MKVLLETQYWPSVQWCATAWQADEVVLEACEHYQKGSLRNRCHLASANGPQRLSIPLVKGKHQQTPIRDVRIAYDEPWQRQHWRSIQAAYGNAPFYAHYAEQIAPFYSRRYAFLFDYNLDIQAFIMQQKLGWTGKISLSEIYQPPFEASKNRWLDGRNKTGARLAHDATRYPQVFEEKHGFLPHLSVLDLLFCCGKQAVDVLASQPLGTE
jgi:hypothetical protein